MNSNRTLVVIPTYNERTNIEEMVSQVLMQDENIDIVIVDDNSPDGTGKWVKQKSKEDPRIFLISQGEKKGLGVAYKKGYCFAVSNGYKLAIGMDADFSHFPGDIKRFLNAAEKADFVIGSRWVPGGNLLNWPWHRILLSRIASFYVYLLHGTGIHDSTSGFQCIRREVLENIDLSRIHSHGYSFQLELKYRAFLSGFQLIEIPIVFQDRTRGVSKIPRRTVLETLWVTLLLKFQAKRIFKKTTT